LHGAERNGTVPSRVALTWLAPWETTTGPFSVGITITHPTGTSPMSRAALATRRACLMNSSSCFVSAMLVSIAYTACHDARMDCTEYDVDFDDR
jgi:hypothetical protein